MSEPIVINKSRINRSREYTLFEWHPVFRDNSFAADVLWTAFIQNFVEIVSFEGIYRSVFIVEDRIDSIANAKTVAILLTTDSTQLFLFLAIINRNLIIETIR